MMTSNQLHILHVGRASEPLESTKRYFRSFLPMSENTYFLANSEEENLHARVSCMATRISKGEFDCIIFHGMFFPHEYYLAEAAKKSNSRVAWSIWGADLYPFARGLLEWPQWVHYFDSIICSPGEANLVPRSFDFVWDYPSRMYAYDLLLELFVDATPDFEAGVVKDLAVLGNSGDPENNHFALIEFAKSRDIKSVILPLSYGGTSHYRDTVLAQAISFFGASNVFPLVEHLPLDRYKILVGEAEYVITGHNRQQSAGLLRIGCQFKKKVCLRKHIDLSESSRIQNPMWTDLERSGFVNLYDFNSKIGDWEPVHRGAMGVDDPLKQLKSATNFYDYLVG